MELALESGRIISAVTEEDIVSHVKGEEQGVLSIGPDSYIQYRKHFEPASAGYVREQLGGGIERVSRRWKGHYDLEYQDSSLDAHFQAVDGQITLDRVLTAFLKYLRGDQSWRSDFRWQKMDL